MASTSSDDKTFSWITFVCVGLIVVLFGLFAFLIIQNGNITSKGNSNEKLLQTLQNAQQDNSKILDKLQQADKDRICNQQATALTFANILDLLAQNFGSAPYPDPDRVQGVQGLKDTAAFYREQAKNPITCLTAPTTTTLPPK